MPIKRLYRLQRARLTATPLALRPQRGLKTALFRGILFIGVLLGAAYAGMHYGQYQQKIVVAKNAQQNQSQMQTSQQQIDALQKAQMLLSQQLTVMQAERDALQQNLTTLQQEAIAGRETVSFFESLLQSNDRNRLASFAACDVQNISSDRLVYRLLLVQGTDKTTELSGKILLNLQYMQNGKKQNLMVGNDAAPISVKHYHRATGELQLPENATGPMLLDVRFVGLQGNEVIASCQKKI